MKNKNPYNSDKPVCDLKPNKKVLKKYLKAANEALVILQDLTECGFIRYELQDAILGNVVLAIKRTEQELTDARNS